MTLSRPHSRLVVRRSRIVEISMGTAAVPICVSARLQAHMGWTGLRAVHEAVLDVRAVVCEAEEGKRLCAAMDVRFCYLIERKAHVYARKSTRHPLTLGEFSCWIIVFIKQSNDVRSPVRPDRITELVSRLQNLNPTIHAICTTAGAPGLSIGVLHSKHFIHSRHYASLSKSLTASAVGILVDDGKLSWTTPIRSVLPDLDSQDNIVNEQATVVDLLSHNTGLAVSNHWWNGAGGEVLLAKNATMAAFNALPRNGKFRNKFYYSNWGYCLLGEMIEKLSGMAYNAFLQKRIFIPLQMKRTSAVHNDSDTNLAKPFAILDDKSAFLLPYPKVQEGTLMAPAQAVRSSTNDMLLYSSALMEAYKSNLPGTLEATYGFGVYRFQLPQTIAGVGCNPMFVKSMPNIVPGPHGGLVLRHHGSVARYTSFFVLLPEYDVAFFVAVNSIGLGDPAGWIAQLIIECVVETPCPSDYVALAHEAAEAHADRQASNARSLEEERKEGTQPKPLTAYVGDYVGLGGLFKIQIRLIDDAYLQLAFQGLDSQVFDLQHYQHDMFTWVIPFNELAKRVRFTFAGPGVYKLNFMANADSEIDRVCWLNEPGLPEGESCLSKQ
ncbi:beta-lactamase/transpeptidase-like protein [Melanomma pulvis-pyrius CBS 109.77]|uniref:Beta-lactamase/transpeptidase-like protein n=1 Tax=Melanomma pulvis-pyrius CBS 109.77 TaxID=1314802 RepID=A0A6A6X592_9PLEO|nr:beta-lactamase/transpeptidase-like protein [Melanomma pulvis-pyrius CBS 109.77]